MCALINWQIKPNAASSVFHESVIFFSNKYLTTFFLKKLNNDTIYTTDVHFDYLDACSSNGGGHCNFLFPLKNQLVKNNALTMTSGFDPRARPLLNITNTFSFV